MRKQLSIAIQDVHQLVGDMIDREEMTDLHKIWSYLDFILGHWFSEEE